MKEKERWVVWVPCKGYVKRWLLLNYNRPDGRWPEIVNLSDNTFLHREFLIRLRRGSVRVEKEMNNAYKDQVAIEITEDTFRRFGWELSGRALKDWNRLLEHEVKGMLRTFVAMTSVTGISLNDCIRRFRRATGMTDLDWETDSIRKEVTRHLVFDGRCYYDEFLKKIEKNVWSVLSENGQLTKRGLERLNIDS